MRTGRPQGRPARGAQGRPLRLARGVLPTAFTLVEVLITVALLGLTLMLLLVPISNSLSYFRTGTARADAQSAARIALDSMARELQEAMYVQLDMYDNNVLAFIPPLRVNPYDPTSEIVTPPRPDWDHGIRYWRALYDPTSDYNPGTHITTPNNTHYLARTVVDQPWYTGDEWNRWNDTWAPNADASSPLGGESRWAPISRIVNADVGLRFLSADSPGVPDGIRATTLQPGYPYLSVKQPWDLGEISRDTAARRYRDLVVGLTPNSADYDVMTLEAQPLVVSGEWLSPVATAGGPDHSLYRTRYPLLRLGAPYFGWSAFGNDQLPLPAGAQPWARDPFLLIFSWKPDPLTGEYAYRLWEFGCFDPRSRTMRVIRPGPLGDVVYDYDTGLYPYRQYDPVNPDPAPRPAFGVDWVDGSMHFDFPAPGSAEAMQAERPVEFTVVDRQDDRMLAGPPAVKVYDKGLLTAWGARTEPPATSYNYFLLPDSVSVRTNTRDGALPDRTLTRVYSTPRDGTDTFQVNDYDFTEAGAENSTKPKYGFVRLPEHLAGGVPEEAAATAHRFWVSFRWHTNGVWDATGYHPDLICAYYRSAAVLDLSLTVTRADPSAKAGQRIAQSAHLTRRVKLHNALREIRYER